MAPAFIEAFVETVRGFKLGDPMDESTYIGPLARAAQLEVLESQVSDALNRGARLAIGGKRIGDRARATTSSRRCWSTRATTCG